MPSLIRNPRTNRMSNLEGFLDAWKDEKHPRNIVQVHLYDTPYGNINNTGELGNYHGHAVSKWHHQFEDAIETGVKQLVLLLVYRFDYITYTSCEGHYYGHKSIHPVERHAGLIPRSLAEQETIVQVFQHLCATVNSQYQFYPIHLQTLIHSIESDGNLYPAVDLFFRKRRMIPWKIYFDKLDNIYESALTQLDAMWNQ